MVATSVVSTLALAVVWSYVWGPEFVRQTAVVEMEKALGRRVTLDKVELDPLRLRVGLQGLTIYEPDRQAAFVRLDGLATQLSWASLRHLAPVVDHIDLTGPKVNLARLNAKQWNYSDIVARLAAQPAKPASTEPAKFSINNIRLTGGHITWVDQVSRSTHQISDLNVALPFISNLPYVAEQFTTPALRVKVNGALLELKGKTRPFAKTRDADLLLNLQGLQLADFMPLVPVKMEAQLIRASLDTQLALVFSQSEAHTKLLLKGQARLHDVLLQDGEGDDLVAWNSLTVKLQNSEPLLQRWQIDLVQLDQPVLWLERLKSGQIGLVEALQPQAQPGETTRAKPQAASKVPSVLALGLKKLVVQQGAIHWVDTMVPAREAPRAQDLTDLDLSIQNLQLVKGQPTATALPVSVRAQHNEQGQIQLQGTVTLPSPTQALAARMQVDVAGIELTSAQPYVADQLNVALTRGALSTQGLLEVTLPSAQTPQLSYRGDVSLQGLRSVDKAGGDDFVRWKRLDFKAVDVQFQDRPKAHPLDLSIGEINVEDFFARILIHADGRINVQDIVKSSSPASASQVAKATPAAPASAVKAAATGPAAGPAPRIALGRMVLKNGRVDFSDNFIKPNYAANLTDLNGTVSAVASDRSKPADVNLRGRIDHDSPLSISGKVHPLSPKLFLQVAARATDIELTRLTPYAAKYAGYPITKGKLSVDLKYLIDNGKLDAQNQVYVNQLTFGSKIDSPDATKLPILFAIGLLTNSKGEMDVNLPISGTLSDPDFSIGGIVWRVIVNLVEKAVNAPFSMLASAFGGDAEELGYVTFAPGSLELSASSKARLDNLARILLDRPALKLEMAGRVDPATEQEGAKRAYVNSRIRAQKVADLAKQGLAANSEQITVTAAEYPKYLEKAYLAEPFEKPRNAVGLIKSLSVAEMEALMMKHALVDEMWFKSMADARAMAVKRYLDEVGKVPVERLFLVASRLTSEGIKDKGEPQRVDFSLAQ